MKINILTLFPEMFGPVTGDSILGKANENGILEINTINIRDYSKDRHLRVDDTPFGGGVGMVMFCQPVFDALGSLGIKGTADRAEAQARGIKAGDKDSKKKSRVIYMSPRGRLLDRKLIDELAGAEEITILCGHYEGVDQRIIDYFGMEEVSIGDFILTGGELPAMVLIDSVARFVPGVLGDSESAEDESIYSGLLEADQYTKPRIYEGMEVPEVLTGGNHKLIRLWQLENSLELTAVRRPDIFEKWMLTRDESLKGLTKRERRGIEEKISELKGRYIRRHI